MRIKILCASICAALPLLAPAAGQSPPAPVAPPVITVSPPRPVPRVYSAPSIPTIHLSAEKPSLRGQKLYVYSFLDVREKELGDKVLAQFHRQVVDALRVQGVNAELMLFRDSVQNPFFVPQAKIPGQRVYDRVPVLETVAANAASEAAANVRYRLLILPADFEMAGAWRYYTVRWIVMDTKTNQLLWRRDYKGSHLTIWRTNENAEGRGRKLTEAGMAMMQEDKLL